MIGTSVPGLSTHEKPETASEVPAAEAPLVSRTIREQVGPFFAIRHVMKTTCLVPVCRNENPPGLSMEGILGHERAEEAGRRNDHNAPFDRSVGFYRPIDTDRVEMARTG